MDRALISRSVQGLVEKGHVLTERDREDRRMVYAALTKSGTDTFEAVLPLMQRRQKHLARPFVTGRAQGYLSHHRTAV